MSEDKLYHPLKDLCIRICKFSKYHCGNCDLLDSDRVYDFIKDLENMALDYLNYHYIGEKVLNLLIPFMIFMMNSVKKFMIQTVLIIVKGIEMKTLMNMVNLIIISMNLSQIVQIMMMKILILNGIKLKIFLQIGENLILILIIPVLMNNMIGLIKLIKLIMMTQTILTALIVIQKEKILIIKNTMSIIKINY